MTLCKKSLVLSYSDIKQGNKFIYETLVVLINLNVRIIFASSRKYFTTVARLFDQRILWPLKVQ